LDLRQQTRLFDTWVEEMNLNRKAILGGLGTGKIELTEGGKLINLTIRNNWFKPLKKLAGFHIAVHVKSENFSQGFLLEKEATGVDVADFKTCYPWVEAKYILENSPVKIELQAFSPFIPGDVLNSSIPAILFIFRVKNTLKRNVHVAISMGLENIVGSSRIGRINKVFRKVGAHGIYFYSSKSTVEDPFHGNMTLGTLPGETTILGQYFSSTHKQENTEPWQEFLATGVIPSNEGGVELNDLAHNIGGILSVRRRLRGGSETEIPFIISWYFNGKSHEYPYGHYYENFFANSFDVAEYVLRNMKTLRHKTRELFKAIQSSNIPPHFKKLLAKSLHVYASNTWLTKDGQLFFISRLGSNTIVEPFDYKLFRSFLTLHLFPQLEVKNLTYIGRLQNIDGSIPDNLGESRIDSPNMGIRGKPALEHPSLYILSIYNTVKSLGDLSILKRFYRSMVKAYEWLVASDINGDWLPDHRGDDSCFYRTVYGAASCSSLLYLAALLALKKTVELAGDREQTSFLAKRIDKTVENIKGILLANERFIHFVSEKMVCNGPTLGHLLGIYLMRSMGLESPFNKKEVLSCLKATLKDLWKTFDYIPFDRDYVEREGKLTSFRVVNPAFTCVSLALKIGVEADGGLLKEVDEVLMLLLSKINEEVSQGVSSKPHGKENDPSSLLASWQLVYSLAGFDLDMFKNELKLVPAVENIKLPLFILGRLIELVFEKEDYGDKFKYTIINDGSNLYIESLILRAPKGEVDVYIDGRKALSTHSRGIIKIRVNAIPSGVKTIELKRKDEI